MITYNVQKIILHSFCILQNMIQAESTLTLKYFNVVLKVKYPFLIFLKQKL